MGIKEGLHSFLKSIQKPCNLKKFSGQTLGVDAYGWLHRGTVACAMDLVLDRPTAKHIEFVMSRVRMLVYFGVVPYLVFDGNNLPSKAGTEAERLKRREESKKLGLELHRRGRTMEAYQEFQKAVDVTPYMARQLIEELKKMKIQYIVAPYEADAQLTYLERQGIINGIVSEDSDLLVFGAKRLLSKLDQHGDCIEINRADFTACRDISLIGWTDADFRRMCILSGCDYLPSIPKMGLKTAYRGIRKHKNVEKVLRMLQFEGRYRVPSGYLDDFKQAELTFIYQRVFCPKSGKLVTLTPLGGVKAEDMPFIGDDLDPEIALGVACGDLDPMTKEHINLKPPIMERLITSISRRQTLASCSVLKPKKPINEFFTPKRIPLAELDPNYLMPSPSQQRLLERHANNTWESSTAPARYDVTRSAPSLPEPRPTGSPMLRTAEREVFLARAARAATSQSGKRQRLCADIDGDSLPSVRECRSRFFTGSSGPSPCRQKLARSSKSRKIDISVFSDEAAENIMSHLPDIGVPADPPEKGTVLKMASEELECVSESISTGPFVRPTGTFVSSVAEPERTITPSTDSTSITPVREASQETSASVLNADSDHMPSEGTLRFQARNHSSSLLSRYASQGSGELTGSAKSDASVGKRGEKNVPTKQKRYESPVFSGSTGGRKEPSYQRLTPLQRLGQSALARSRSLNSIGVIPSVGRSRLPGIASDHITRPRQEAIFATNCQGSEDLISPSSDEDNVDPRSHTGNPAPLNLKRFSFTPQNESR